MNMHMHIDCRLMWFVIRLK